MPIEDHLGYGVGNPSAPLQIFQNPLPHPLSHAPGEEDCPGRANPSLTDYHEVRIDVTQEREFDGEQYKQMYCTGCGKQWWENG